MSSKKGIKAEHAHQIETWAELDSDLMLMIYIDVLLIWWCSWWNKKLDLIWICFHLLYICIGKKIFCQIFEWEKKVSRKKKHSGLFIHECREILWLLPTPLYDITCSGFVGGATWPPEFGGSVKGWSLISAYQSLAITASTSGYEQLSTVLTW